MALVGACALTTVTVAVPVDAASKPAPAPAMAAPTSAPAPVASPPPPATTIERIRSTGKLTLGYRPDAAPMSYRDGAGKPSGYSVQLCTRVADALKAELSLPSLDVRWVAVTAGYVDVQQHAVDLVCADDEVTLAHRFAASFSIPVFPGGTSALVRKDGSADLQRTLEERPAPYQPLWRGTAPPTLSNRTYSAIGGSATLETLMARIVGMHLTASVAPVDTYDAGVAAVLKRRSDVLFGDRAQLLQAVQRSPDAKDLRVLSRHYTFGALALAVPRNDDDFRLAVDRALTGIFADPKFAELYAASFGPPDAETVAFFRTVALPK
jgi:ABC-type amino acid transport substrate-binding protein